MEIFLNARVNSADGPCGRVKRVVINRLSHQLTHLVVTVEDGYTSERLVPLHWVVGACPNWIQLCCTGDCLELLTPFAEVEWSAMSLFQAEPLLDEYLIHKLLMRPHFCVIKRRHIAPDELAVRRGDRVKGADGRVVGRLERLVADLEDGSVRQLILRMGPKWKAREACVPVSQIDDIKDETIFLKLAKRDVMSLPFASEGGRQLRFTT
jgi:sporulation protein YlmC with PRC-barrel domain